jgi:DNA-binding transcriptional MerR regulator
MAQWYIKELSTMTKVSVRTLHHYDHIGLLKPSVRTSSSYRLYSEQDLAKLQQIIALKFFGFSLEQIKTMLKKKLDLAQHLRIQQLMLQDQVEHLRLAQDALTETLKRCAVSNSVDWNVLVTLIERYRMAEDLKKTWAGKLSEKQQSRYLDFMQAYPKETEQWQKTIEAINSLKLGDPEGPDGRKAVTAFLANQKALTAWEKHKEKLTATQEDAEEMMALIDKFKTEGIPLSPEGNMWLAKALTAYWLHTWENLHQEITKNIHEDPAGAVGQKIVTQWREIISNQCMGATLDFFLGMTLLREAAQSKVVLQDPQAQKSLQEQGPEMIKCAPMMLDVMALSWIDKALKAH